MRKVYVTPSTTSFELAHTSMLCGSQLSGDGSQNVDIEIGEGEHGGAFQSGRFDGTDGYWDED